MAGKGKKGLKSRGRGVKIVHEEGNQNFGQIFCCHIARNT